VAVHRLVVLPAQQEQVVVPVDVAGVVDIAAGPA
jgi:hypothetical protein